MMPIRLLLVPVIFPSGLMQIVGAAKPTDPPQCAATCPSQAVNRNPGLCTDMQSDIQCVCTIPELDLLVGSCITDSCPNDAQHVGVAIQWLGAACAPFQASDNSSTSYASSTENSVLTSSVTLASNTSTSSRTLGNPHGTSVTEIASTVMPSSTISPAGKHSTMTTPTSWSLGHSASSASDATPARSEAIPQTPSTEAHPTTPTSNAPAAKPVVVALAASLGGTAAFAIVSLWLWWRRRTEAQARSSYVPRLEEHPQDNGVPAHMCIEDRLAGAPGLGLDAYGAPPRLWFTENGSRRKNGFRLYADAFKGGLPGSERGENGIRGMW
ncbi:hypothetical protein C8Q73DRAFT_807908 [Cubamyces lactineus]|nr:hypothetical protein C8Q73DRAFT_807908 [Cubamyces lactineus]